MTREAHVDESGIHSGSPVIAVGMLVAQDAEKLREAICSIRGHHHFGNEIKSAKSSTLRQRVYRDVLAEVVRHNVQMIVVLAEKQAASEHLGLPARALGDYFTELVIRLQADSLAGCDVYLDQKPGKGREQMMHRLAADLPQVRSLQEIDSRFDDLMQVADLVCGTVFGVETGNERKQALYEMIASQVVVWRWSPDTREAGPLTWESPPNSERYPR